MSSWWRTKPGQRTVEDRRQAQQAYYRVFFGSVEGCRVYYDLLRHVHTLDGQSAEVMLALREFVDSLAWEAGARDRMVVIDAQVGDAARYVEPLSQTADVEQGYVE